MPLTEVRAVSVLGFHRIEIRVPYWCSVPALQGAPILNAQATKAASDVRPADLSEAGGTANEIDPAFVLETVQGALDDNKAEGIVSFDLRNRTSVSDHMVICSGRSTTHVGALAEYIRQDLKKIGADIVAITGTGQGDWICVDANSVVVHIFRPEVRAYYQLEKMWDPKFDVNADAA